MKYNRSLSSPQISRRDFMKLSGIAGGTAALAACGSQSTPTTAPEPEKDTTEEKEEPVQAEKVVLSFWTPGGSDLFCEGFGTIADNYMAENPNIELEPAQCNPTGENYTEVLLANIAAGSPPDATIVWSSPVAYAVRGALLPLDDKMATSKYSQASSWPEGVLASCRYDGKIYGLPVTAGSYALFYNEEMFEAAGISSAREDFPKTWDELRALSKELTKWEGDLLVSAGFFPWGSPGDWYGMAVEFPIWAHTNGGKIFDPDQMKYTINSDQNIEMMEYALAWWNDIYKGDFIKVNTSANWGGYADGEGRPPAFQEGKMGIHNNGFWLCSDMYGAEVKYERWNVAQYPVGPSGKETASGYWPNWLVLPMGSQHPDEAFDYLDYMSAIGVQVWFDNIPDIPTNANVPDTLVPGLLAEKRGEAFATETTNFFRKQLDVAVPMWNSPVDDFYLDQLSKALEQIINGTASPSQALGEAQTACQDELDKVLNG